MYLEIEFEEQDNSFDLEFEQVTEISDGGYDRGYADGYSKGDADGQAKGRAEGESIGFADALAKRTDLVVTENGDYTPSEGNTGFKSVSVNVQAKSDMDALIDGTITEVNSTASKVAVSTFYQRKALTSVNFPNATSIGDNAFNACSKLTSANFPKATSIGQGAFKDCAVLTNLYLPSVTKIQSNAFQYCYGLKSVNLSSATNIGSSAFQYCSNIASIDFSSATHIDTSSFEYCYKLTDANLPNVTKISSSAFSSCRSLKSVILRTETVCSLANKSAFNKCYHILGTVNSEYNPTGAKDGYFYVPRALVEDYKVATNWSTYSTQFRALEDYTVDGTITGALDPNKI